MNTNQPSTALERYGLGCGRGARGRACAIGDNPANPYESRDQDGRVKDSKSEECPAAVTRSDANRRGAVYPE